MAETKNAERKPQDPEVTRTLEAIDNANALAAAHYLKGDFKRFGAARKASYRLNESLHTLLFRASE